MTHVSPSFSATLRVRLEDAPGTFARVAEAIGEAGGSLGAIDIVRVEPGHKVRDVTVSATDEQHLHRIAEAVQAVEGVEVAPRLRPNLPDAPRRQDRGRVERAAEDARRPVDGLHARRRARSRRRSRTTRSAAWNLTIKQNTVAVVSDGTAVLGLGDIGPEAAMPVMEGKAVLFKEFGGVDAWPICLATKDPDEIVAVCKAIAPGFGGINLEDISAPRCFEIEARLREELDIPVFHDDQHGTAIVVLAALLNALKVVGKRLEDVKHRDDGRGRGRDRDRRTSSSHAGATARRRLRPRGRRLSRARRGCTRTRPRSPSGRTPTTCAAAPTRRSRARTSSSASPRRRRHVRGRADDGGGRDRLRDGEPDARGPAGGARRRRRRHRDRAAPTTRTRSTTCSRSPASSAARSTCARRRSRRR